MKDLPDYLTGDDIIFFKCGQITSTDVERNFQQYKTSIVDYRQSFNFGNIKKMWSNVTLLKVKRPIHD
jgi:hypothetical protein